jgi:hypothetical protein
MSQHDDAEYEAYDEHPDPDRLKDIRRSDQRPGKVQAIAILTLIGGIYALVHALAAVGVSVGWCCLWPGVYYGLVLGIMAIIKGSSLLGQNAASNPPPTGIAIMMIINIINGDIVNCVMGVLNLVFCGDPEVKGYFKG